MKRLDIEHGCAIGIVICLAEIATAINLGAPLWVTGAWLIGAIICSAVVGYYELQPWWLGTKFRHYTKDLERDR